MQQAATAAPSFAGLMASLTAAAAEPEWNVDGLADDVAVVSLEGTQRNRESASQAEAIIEVDEDGQSGPLPAIPRKPPAIERDPEWTRHHDTSAPRELSIVEADESPAVPAVKNLKRASITIRMTADESAQLHARAAESGLTVSAYLRSCAFEVENLRAQVKDALAQLRKTPAAESKEGQREEAAERPSLLKRMARLWPRTAADRRATA